MEELIEQYNNARKWKKDMFIAMIIMLVLAALMIAAGFIVSELIALFLISGGIIAALGGAICIISGRTFKKVDGLVRKYLSDNGKSEEEINSMLGETGK